MKLRTQIDRLARAWFADQRTDELRNAARTQLRSTFVSNEDASLKLDGAIAEVVAESENVGNDEGKIKWYYLTQIVRTPTGEYFLLKTTDKSPFIKHLTQSRAKLLLRGKYKLPNSHA